MFLLFVLAAAAVAPASDASVEAFLAAIPPTTAEPDKPSALDIRRLDELKAQNPKREREVGTTFATFRQCQNDSSEKMAVDSLRGSARKLGDAKLQRLTAFYKSADFAVFGRISEKKEAEQTPAEKQEVARIMAAYPLQDFLESTKQTTDEMMSSGLFFSQLEACERQLDESLTKLKLKH